VNIKNVYERSKNMIGAININYGMDASEFNDIYKNSPGKYEAIMASFRFGYMQGKKAAQAEGGKIKKEINRYMDGLSQEALSNVLRLLIRVAGGTLDEER